MIVFLVYLTKLGRHLYTMEMESNVCSCVLPDIIATKRYGRIYICVA